MGDRRTEPLEPYEPAEPAYDWDYDDAGPRRPNVLWGRVALLGALFLLAFLLGRWTAPEGASPEELRQTRAELREAQDRIEVLENQAAQPTPTPTDLAPEESPAEEDEEEEPEGTVYVVEPGDTLVLIAEQECGDPALDELIADANGITDPTQLSVGDELIIPADCGEQ